MAVKPIPDGYHSITPMLIVDGAGRLIDFMKNAFGAEVRMQMPMPDGKVAHAELTVGDSTIMVSDANEMFPAMRAALHVYLPDVDEAYRRALQAGATSKEEPTNRFYGDRAGTVVDPAGNLWSLSTHVEDVSDEEVRKRMEAMATA